MDKAATTRDSVIDAILGAGAALASVLHPGAGIAVAGATPVISGQAKDFLNYLSSRGKWRSGRVFEVAAMRAELSPSEIKARCDGDIELEQLAIDIAGASENTTVLGKLAAYVAIFEQCLLDSRMDRTLAADLIKILDDLSIDHLDLLSRFARPLHETFGELADNPEWNNGRPDTISRQQIDEQLAPDLPYVSQLLAGLEMHGLVESETGGVAGVGLSQRPSIYWRLTDYGQQIHERLIEVESVLAKE